MRHKIGDGRKLNRSGSHRKALFRNLVTQLIQHERIKTTYPKAQDLKSIADGIISLAKKGTSTAFVQAGGYIRGREALLKTFTILADRYKDRNGGYTRVIKNGYRYGDHAPLAFIEFVDNNKSEILKTSKYKKCLKEVQNDIKQGKSFEVEEEVKKRLGIEEKKKSHSSESRRMRLVNWAETEKAYLCKGSSWRHNPEITWKEFKILRVFS